MRMVCMNSLEQRRGRLDDPLQKLTEHFVFPNLKSRMFSEFLGVERKEKKHKNYPNIALTTTDGLIWAIFFLPFRAKSGLACLFRSKDRTGLTLSLLLLMSFSFLSGPTPAPVRTIRSKDRSGITLSLLLLMSFSVLSGSYPAPAVPLRGKT